MTVDSCAEIFNDIKLRRPGRRQSITTSGFMQGPSEPKGSMPHATIRMHMHMPHAMSMYHLINIQRGQSSFQHLATGCVPQRSDRVRQKRQW